MCQGLNSHYFHIIGDGHQPNSRGLYTHYKDSVIEGGMSLSPKNATFDHGTDGGGFPGFTSLLVIYRKIVCFHPGSESLGKIHSKCSTSSSKKQIPDRFADTFLGKKKYPKNDW